jgi:deoxyribonuclease V
LRQHLQVLETRLKERLAFNVRFEEAIGVPKTPFHAIGHLPGSHRGDVYVLTKEWGAQGASIRLKAGVKPVYVSPGHLVDLDSAIALALAWSSGRHRVPEPLAAAHTMSAHARNALPGTG